MTCPRDGFFVASLLALTGCREPTQITVQLVSDLPCDVLQNGGVSLSASSPGRAESSAPLVVSRECKTGPGNSMGTMVLVPSGEPGALVGIRAVAGVGKRAEDCKEPGYEGCVVARREVRFQENRALVMRIDLRAECEGNPCDPKSTCVAGKGCRGIEVPEGKCEGVCGEEALPPVGGGGGQGGAGVGGMSGSSGQGGVGGNEAGQGGMSGGGIGGAGEAGASGGGTGGCSPLSCKQRTANCGTFDDCGDALSCKHDSCSEKEPCSNGCPAGMTCGLSRPFVCECYKNSYFCLGDQLMKCSSSGANFHVQATCSPGTCDESSKKCGEYVGSWCEGKMFHQTSTSDPQDCGSQVCVPGVGCKACFPSSLLCDGFELKQCDANGDASSLKEKCSTVEECERGISLGYCQ